MNTDLRDDMAVQQERTLLVCVLLPESTADPHDPLGELRSLAKTADAMVCDEIVCKRRLPHSGHYIGKGKAEEIALRVEMNEIDVVIFDNDLSPAQIRELERITQAKVIDRSELILDIFAAHSKSAQSSLQVELAQLEYTYPRLTGMWTHLDRHGGGVGTRGPGERQIETDRRIVQKRISFLKKKLTEIDKRKVREVKRRQDQFCVCLVGYTNVGKSTMLNLLTGSDVLAENKLFATLETRTRRWGIDGKTEVLLSDTVGFIRDLPHHLVASFRATLEEAIHADLLLHVADASSHMVMEQICAVEDVLEELDCDPRRTVLLLNKIDCVQDPTVYQVLSAKFPDAIHVSAVTGEGTDALIEAVAHRAAGLNRQVEISTDVRNGKLIQYITQHGEILRQDYTDTTATLEAILPSVHILEIERLFGDQANLNFDVS
ncbi:MAG: GTPase HflX [Phycisphaerales bacterium]|jgi:GTPase|nr:GTPase HflX [Phycisphaerales bacterium]MBT7170221.1 GTPase HflX [Phycisphaerales bacterium]